MIYFIMGISGSGKSTLIENIKNLNIPDLVQPLSYKTRVKREFEVDGVDAYFLTKKEFLKGIENGEFLEYALVHGKEYYGTKWNEIEESIQNGKTVLKEIDLNGLIKLKNERSELNGKYKTIFLDLPIAELKNRLLKRQANIEIIELEKRLQSAFIEEENLRKLCDFDIDATLSEEEILKEVLKIIR